MKHQKKDIFRLLSKKRGFCPKKETGLRAK